MEFCKELIEKYNNMQGGIIQFFNAIQEKYNYIPPNALIEASKAFDISVVQAYGVATFYSHYSLEKRGKYIIRMCESMPCFIAGAEEILQTLESVLEIKPGETTADGLFTLELTECVGQCQGSPVITINGEPLLNVSPEQIPVILSTYQNSSKEGI